MIVFLSFPSSLSCSRASTLICNYLYIFLLTFFLYTQLGAPTSTFHDDVPKILFLDRLRRFSSSQDGKSPTFLCEWKTSGFFMDFLLFAFLILSTVFLRSFHVHSPSVRWMVMPPKPHGNFFNFPFKFFHVFFSRGKQTFMSSFG